MSRSQTIVGMVSNHYWNVFWWPQIEKWYLPDEYTVIWTRTPKRKPGMIASAIDR